MRLGSVEINKSNIICAIGNDSGEIIYKKSFDISLTDEIINIIYEYFDSKKIKGLSIIISENLKEEYKNYNWKDALKNFISVPIIVNYLPYNADIDINIKKSLLSIRKII